jgi:hypothetical protein
MAAEAAPIPDPRNVWVRSTMTEAKIQAEGGGGVEGGGWGGVHDQGRGGAGRLRVEL